MHPSTDSEDSENTEERIRFRPLHRADLPAMQRWLADPDVAAWWSERDLGLDALTAKYQPRIDGAEPVRGFAIVIDGESIGFIQAYRIGDYPDYQQQLDIDPDAVVTDLFIGEEAWRNRGWGTAVLRAFLDRVVFGEMGAEIAVIAPEPTNTRAIRVYERVGFQWVKTVSVKDDDDSTRATKEYVMLLHPKGAS